MDNGFWTMLVQWFVRNKGKAIGGLIGFVLAVLMLCIGFWRTMLILLLVALGAAVGSQTDDVEKRNRWLERFLGKKD